jgi:hypothetical protein
VLPSLISRRQRDAFISAAHVEHSFHVCVHGRLAPYSIGLEFPKLGWAPQSVAQRQFCSLPLRTTERNRRWRSSFITCWRGPCARPGRERVKRRSNKVAGPATLVVASVDLAEAPKEVAKMRSRRPTVRVPSNRSRPAPPVPVPSHRSVSCPTVPCPVPPFESRPTVRVPSHRSSPVPQLQSRPTVRVPSCRGSFLPLVKKDPHHRRESFLRSRRGSFPRRPEVDPRRRPNRISNHQGTKVGPTR